MTKLLINIFSIILLGLAVVTLTQCEFSPDKVIPPFGKGKGDVLEPGNVKYRIPLNGEWKFSIGDSISWADTSYSDTGWETISVPSSWEDQGFHGYDGYAWYRKTFELPGDELENMYLLELGRIDDVDEVYVNGNLVGSTGQFPPRYETAYNTVRVYQVPSSYLKAGSPNLIAIRVYDEELSGGIVEGQLTCVVFGEALKLDYDLSGEWKFRFGDDLNYRFDDYDDSGWMNVSVPAYWREYGYGDENGYGWYRKTFTVPENLKGKQLILALGRIDDIDEVYLNGKLIGYTGRMKRNESDILPMTEYLELRGYLIPIDELKFGEENLLAVRIFDKVYQGGIYQGPIGIVEYKKYLEYWRNDHTTRHLQ